MHRVLGMLTLVVMTVLAGTSSQAAPDQVRVRFRFFETDDPEHETFVPLRSWFAKEPTEFLSILTLKCTPGRTATRTREFRSEWVASMLGAGGTHPSPTETAALARRCSTRATVTCSVAQDGFSINLAFRWEATVPDASRSEPGRLCVADHVIETNLLVWDGETQLLRFPGGRRRRSRYLAVDAALYDSATGKPIRIPRQGGRTLVVPILAAPPPETDAAGQPAKPAEPATKRAPIRLPTLVGVHVQLLRIPGDVDLGLDRTFTELREAARKEPGKLQGQLSTAIRELPAKKKQFLYPLSTVNVSGNTSTCEWRARTGADAEDADGSAVLHATAACAADMYSIDLKLKWDCKPRRGELAGTQRGATYQMEETVRTWDNERLFIPLSKEGASVMEFLVVSASLVNPAGLSIRPRQLR